MIPSKLLQNISTIGRQPSHSMKRKSLMTKGYNDDVVAEFADFQSRSISLLDWWNRYVSSRSLDSSSEPPPVPLMDLRSEEEFRKRRLLSRQLLVVPFPAKYLQERSFELPARHIKFSIVVNQDQVEHVQNFLLGPKPNSRKRPRKPWKVDHVLISNDALWKEAKELGLVASSKELDDPSDFHNHFPLPRLWQPDPMVESILLPLLKGSISKLDCLHLRKFEVWDLASGAGRDVAFLAEELASTSTPINIVGLDHRYNEKEKALTRGFWERRGVGKLTQCVKMNLSRWELVSQNMSTKRVLCLFAVRFWKPELVAAIAGKNSGLSPGTIFGLSHFCKPSEGATWDFEHPSEKTVLERTQLRKLFEDLWDILYDEIALDSDHGRTMIHFVARKL